jgi:hypothetical protein
MQVNGQQCELVALPCFILAASSVDTMHGVELTHQCRLPNLVTERVMRGLHSPIYNPRFPVIPLRILHLLYLKHLAYYIVDLVVYPLGRPS